MHTARSQNEALPQTSPWDNFLTPAFPDHSSKDVGALRGKRILITGAGGFIGSGLADAIASLGIESLVLLDNAEHGLHDLDRNLQIPGNHKIIVGSINDHRLIDELFEQNRPQIVFHVAALKHVPLMESNPFAAVETNALGTWAVANAAALHGAEQLILISTDKAVDPVSVMGATKRIAELVILSQACSTSMKALRFCNVLGSSGSVAPLFQQQIEAGETVTVTDRRATRYFLSIQETIQCLIATAASPRAGLFVPRIGSPYRIEDLARFLLARAPHLSPEPKIGYIGLRPGEKLHEQMTSPRESVSKSSDNEIIVSVETPGNPDLQKYLEKLEIATRHRALPGLLSTIEKLLPEYTPSDFLLQKIHSSQVENR